MSIIYITATFEPQFKAASDFVHFTNVNTYTILIFKWLITILTLYHAWFMIRIRWNPVKILFGRWWRSERLIKSWELLNFGLIDFRWLKRVVNWYLTLEYLKTFYYLFKFRILVDCFSPLLFRYFKSIRIFQVNRPHGLIFLLQSAQVPSRTKFSKLSHI